MAAVARHINHFMTLGDVLHAFDMTDLDPVIDLVPEPAQHHFQKADRRIGVVRGDFVAIAQRLLTGFGFADVLPLGFFKNRLLDQGFVQKPLDQVAPVRHIRTDHGGLEVAKVGTQNALSHAQGQLVTLVLADQVPQMDRRGKLHARFAAKNQDAHQPAKPTGHRPAIGEQQLPRAGFAIR